MKLGIISDCTHYKTPDGRIGTENHILLRQFEALCSYYAETLICCPFGLYDSSKVISFYNVGKIMFTPVPKVGGDTLKAKVQLLLTLPKWIKAFKKIDRFSDVVYQRFPNNLNIPAFFYFRLKTKKSFATYTGTWKNHKGEPATYRFQRYLLTNFFKGPVWVYAETTLKEARLHNGFSPSYSSKEWHEETNQVEKRIINITKEGIPKFRLITVGTLIDYKNQLLILKTCVILKKKQFAFSLTIVGDGPMRKELEQFIIDNHLKDEVKMTGKVNAEDLRELYRRHDFAVQAPLFEGFGKVPIEAFFHGVIPVINNISLANNIIGNEERGFLFDATSEHNLVEVINKISNNIQLLPGIIMQGRAYAYTHTLNAWAEEYYKTVNAYFEEET